VVSIRKLDAAGPGRRSCTLLGRTPLPSPLDALTPWKGRTLPCKTDLGLLTNSERRLASFCSGQMAIWRAKGTMDQGGGRVSNLDVFAFLFFCLTAPGMAETVAIVTKGRVALLRASEDSKTEAPAKAGLTFVWSSFCVS